MGGRVMPSMLGRIVEGAFRPSTGSQAVFSQFRYPARGGFYSFFRSLYERVRVQTGERAVSIDWKARQVRFASGRQDSYDVLASSIPLPELMEILVDVPAHLRGIEKRLRWTQLLCVNMVIKRPHLTDCHWFYIYDHEIEPCRVSIPSNFSAELAPGRTAVQAEVYRRNDETFDVDAVVTRTVAQMADLLRFEQTEVEAVGHQLVGYAYVISDHQRATTVETLTNWLKSEGIYTMGLHGRWSYVWSDAAFRQGRETAALIRGGGGHGRS
jgi:UDP-galactopyranose mutase